MDNSCIKTLDNTEVLSKKEKYFIWYVLIVSGVLFPLYLMINILIYDGGALKYILTIGLLYVIKEVMGTIISFPPWKKGNLLETRK